MSTVTLFSMKANSKRTNVYSCTRYVKNFENLISEEDKAMIGDFSKKADFTICYVDPSDLSYHNFENILNLDVEFTRQRKYVSGNCQPTQGKTNIVELCDGVFKANISNDLNDCVSYQDKIKILKDIDKLDLYTLPANSESRGGKRMIFFSDTLEEEINKIIKKLDTSLNEEKSSNKGKYNVLFDKFKTCNSVFRYNKFVKGNGDFKSHYDTPFVSKMQNQISKFTILIYLTDCSNENGLLCFKDLGSEDDLKRITSINAGDIFIFNQQLEHSGSAPGDDSEKIFIRSELIYDDLDSYGQDPEVAKLFNKACFFAKESIILGENLTEEEIKEKLDLQVYSNNLFNHTMKMRMKAPFDLGKSYNKYEMMDQSMKRMENMENMENMDKHFLKNNLGTTYVTNGNDFFFSCKTDKDENNVLLKSYAIAVVHDYFNCTFFENKKDYCANFNIGKSLTETRTKEIKMEITSDEQVFEMLESFTFPCGDYPRKHYYDHSISPTDSVGEIETQKYKNDCSFGYEECIGFCYTNGLYEITDFERKKFRESTPGFTASFNLNCYGVNIDSETMEVTDSEIILTRESIDETINFASCQCCHYDIEGNIYKKHGKVKSFVFPNIKYQKFDNGYKLSVDMFNNGFIYSRTFDVNEPFTVKNENFVTDEKYDITDEKYQIYNNIEESNEIKYSPLPEDKIF